MFVAYYVHAMGWGEYQVLNKNTVRYHSSDLLTGSECFWIVPGTVNPNDD